MGLRRRVWNRRVRRSALALVALLALAGGTERADAGEIALEITTPTGGAPSLVLITCDGRTERRVTPVRLTFIAADVTCRIEAEGPLEVKSISSSGSVSRTRTNGGSLRLRLS